jgi:RHS repeat-associated protein
MIGQTSYFHYDGLGSTRCLTDANGNVTDSYAYTAFGEPVDTGAANPTVNPFQFVGREGYYLNPDSGDYYVRARVYQPVLVRWLSLDPIGYSGVSVTLYAYAGNNPTNFVDSSGEATAQPQKRHSCSCVKDVKIEDITQLERGYSFTVSITLDWKPNDTFKMGGLFWYEHSDWKSILPPGYQPVDSGRGWLEFAHGTPRLKMFADYLGYEEKPGGPDAQDTDFSISDDPQVPKLNVKNRTERLFIIVLVRNAEGCACQGYKDQARYVQEFLVIDENGDVDFSPVQGKPKSNLVEVTDPKILQYIWPGFPPSSGLTKPGPTKTGSRKLGAE